MPRLPSLTDRDSLAPRAQEVFDYLVESRGGSIPPYSILLNSPEVCYRVGRVGEYCRFGTVLDPQTLELVTLTAAREGESELQWVDHTALALKAGISQDVIDIIGHRQSVDSLAEEIALPICCVREILLTHRLKEGSFSAALRQYGERGVVDLLTVAGHYFLLSCLFNGLEIPPTKDGQSLP